MTSSATASSGPVRGDDRSCTTDTTSSEQKYNGLPSASSESGRKDVAEAQSNHQSPAMSKDHPRQRRGRGRGVDRFARGRSADTAGAFTDRQRSADRKSRGGKAKPSAQTRRDELPLPKDPRSAQQAEKGSGTNPRNGSNGRNQQRGAQRYPHSRPAASSSGLPDSNAKSCAAVGAEAKGAHVDRSHVPSSAATTEDSSAAHATTATNDGTEDRDSLAKSDSRNPAAGQSLPKSTRQNRSRQTRPVQPGKSASPSSAESPPNSRGRRERPTPGEGDSQANRRHRQRPARSKESQDKDEPSDSSAPRQPASGLGPSEHTSTSRSLSPCPVAPTVGSCPQTNCMKQVSRSDDRSPRRVRPPPGFG